MTVNTPPTVTCTPSATSITTGNAVTWTATPSGGTGTYTYSWSGTPSISGTTQSISPTYTAAGTATASVTVTSGGVSSPATTCSSNVTVNTPPTVTLTASPTSIVLGGSSTLTWSSTNATSCTGTGFNTGGGTSGTASVAPTITTVYNVSCAGPGGTGTGTSTVTVQLLPNLAAGGVLPTTATASTTTTLTATVNNLGNAGAASGFPDLFEINPGSIPPTFAGIATLRAYTSGVLAAGANNTASISYTFPTADTYYVRMCSNLNTNNTNVIAESNYGDNCGPWTTVTVSAYPLPTASLTASPTSVVLGGSSTLTWDSTNATTCVGTGFSTANAVSGTASVTPTTTTTYRVTCTGTGGSIVSSSVVTVQALPDLTADTVTQTTATEGAATTLTAVIRNGGNSGTGTTFPDLFEISPNSVPASFSTIATLKTYTSAALAANASNTASISYTFPTAGTYYVRACANMDTSGTNIVTESNYGNNCSGLWTQVTVTNSSSCTGGQTLQADGTCACPSGQSLVGGTCATNAVSDLTAGSVIPAAATTNVATTFSTPITNGGTGDTTSGFPVLFEINSGSIPADFASISQLKTYDSPTLTAGSSDTASISYTFPTAGTYYMRACANVNTSGINIVTESDYGNNCGAWTQVTVTDSSCIGGQTLQADGTCACPSGQSLVGGTCAPTCTGGQTLQSDGTCACPSGQSLDASGSCAVTCPAQRLCTSAANICGMTNTGSSQCDGTCTLSTPPDSSCAPQLTLIADRTHVAAGATTTITYAAQYVTSCTFTSPDGTATDLPVVNGMVATSTVVTAPVNSSQTYKLTCDGVSVQVVIGLLPSFHEN